MIQKLNNEQLQQLYFESSIPTKSFREHEDDIKPSRSKQSFFDTDINYKRFSEAEINRFENFFNTHVYPTPQNYTFKDPEIAPTAPALVEEKEVDVHGMAVEEEVPQLSQLEKDLLQQNEINDDIQNEVQKETNHVPSDLETVEAVKEAPVPFSENIDVEHDDDLIYLETLINNEGAEIAALDSNSLSDILAEIVDNEKEPISNYESSVFDANIQMLFNESPEVSSNPVPVSEVEVPTSNFELPPIPIPGLPSDEMLTSDSTAETEIPMPNFDLPPIPIPELPADELLTSDSTAEIEIPIPDFGLPPIPEAPVDVEPETLLKSEIEAPVPMPNFDLPLIPEVPVDVEPETLLKSNSTAEIETPAPNFELPLVPKAPVDELAINNIVDSEAMETPEMVAGNFVEATVEDFVPEKRSRKEKNKNKRRNPKLAAVLDTILVLVILVIISVLVWNYRHLLPFDLPFGL